MKGTNLGLAHGSLGLEPALVAMLLVLTCSLGIGLLSQAREIRMSAPTPQAAGAPLPMVEVKSSIESRPLAAPQPSTAQPRTTAPASTYRTTSGSSARAWAVGSNGSIYSTSNGGASWNPQSSGSASCLWALDFIDANEGWTVGQNGTILHTDNAGTSWTAQTSGTGALLDGVDFVDALNGWAVGWDNAFDGIILHTTDGGATWTRQPYPGKFRLSAVRFVDANHGYAVGADGVLSGLVLHTSDGGTTWKQQRIPWTVQVAAVDLVAGGQVFAVAGDGVLATVDDGTWQSSSIPTPQIFDLNGISFVDGNRGWAVGQGITNRDGTADDAGRILHTTNGGTWTEQSVGISAILQGVDFADGVDGIVVGQGRGTGHAVVLTTDDGGSSWVPRDAGAMEPLTAVCLAPAS
jgi:photosystem II stability/assembly factor-like uncharacterized protein